MTHKQSTKDECFLGKTGGSTKEMAVAVMALMRNDETKLMRQVKRFIKKHKSLAKQVLSTDLDGWTPVHACALRCSKTLLKVFLESGIDVNIHMGQPDGLPNNCSLLHMAALRGDVKILELLVSRGADVNARDSCDNTPAIYAGKRKHRRAVRFLEEHGASLDGVDFPALHDLSADCITPQPSSAKFCFF